LWSLFLFSSYFFVKFTLKFLYLENYVKFVEHRKNFKNDNSKTENSRISTFDPNNFSFGNTFIDHMIICEYENGKWGDVKLVPYGPIPFTPAMMGVNYGQACFEGMKAYKDKDGQVFLFRPEKNFERINKSAKRLAMPEVTEEMFLDGLKALVDIDREWIPQGKECLCISDH
jgi:branched-chain amino acid aminotransferase